MLTDNGQEAYETRLRGAWRGQDGKPEIIPDGGVVSVRLSLMDAQQRAAAASPAAAVLDENAAARVQGIADGHTEVRERRERDWAENSNGQAAYEKRISDAWRNPPNAAGDAP